MDFVRTVKSEIADVLVGKLYGGLSRQALNLLFLCGHPNLIQSAKVFFFGEKHKVLRDKIGIYAPVIIISENYYISPLHT